MKNHNESIKKVVLAYSGGLDTSVILKYLQEKYNAEVIAFVADVGQEESDPQRALEQIEKRAYETGASKVYVLDLKNEFANDYILPALKMGALYEGKYPLSTSLSRPLIAKYLVEIAHKEGADAVAHGSTGKGNDQVRFEVSVRALDPSLNIIAPLRTWELRTREDEIKYAREKGIPIEVSEKKIYSIDRNLWGVSVEAGPLEDPWTEPPRDSYVLLTPPEEAPDEPEYVEVSFREGKPVAVNGQEMDLVALISTLTKLGARHSIGRVDMVEDRLVGIKSREIYEVPAAAILYEAHRSLEEMTLDRETLQFKDILAIKYSQLVYYGWWFSPLREALDAFVEKTQACVTGTVRLKLYKGRVSTVGRRSPYSLYREELATYGAGDEFNQSLAEGFNRLWGLPLEVIGLRDRSSGV